MSILRKGWDIIFAFMFQILIFKVGSNLFLSEAMPHISGTAQCVEHIWSYFGCSGNLPQRSKESISQPTWEKFFKNQHNWRKFSGEQVWASLGQKFTIASCPEKRDIMWSRFPSWAESSPYLWPTSLSENGRNSPTSLHWWTWYRRRKWTLWQNRSFDLCTVQVKFIVILPLPFAVPILCLAINPALWQ